MFILENTAIGKKMKQFLEASHNFANGNNDSEIVDGALYAQAQDSPLERVPYNIYLYTLATGFVPETKEEVIPRGFSFKSCCSAVGNAFKAAAPALENIAEGVAPDVVEVGCDSAAGALDVGEEAATDAAATAAVLAEAPAQGSFCAGLGTATGVGLDALGTTQAFQSGNKTNEQENIAQDSADALEASLS